MIYTDETNGAYIWNYSTAGEGTYYVSSNTYDSNSTYWIDPQYIDAGKIAVDPVGSSFYINSYPHPATRQLLEGAVVYIEKKTPVFRDIDAAAVMAKMTKSDILVVEADGTITLVPPEKAGEFVKERRCKNAKETTA